MEAVNQPKKPAVKGPAKPASVINAHEAYSLQEFRKRCGLGQHAWRNVREHIQVIEIGRKRFVKGADWLAFLDSLKN
jgi:hypothetical protein